jgi:hypothetical protein
MSIADVRNMISSVIDRFGGDSYEARVDRNTWRITSGSATGFILIFENAEDEESTELMIIFPVMRVPVAKSLAFYRRLLEINTSLRGRAAFAVNEDNAVTLVTGRTIRDLDLNELASMVIVTAALADDYDDILLDEFGRENAFA